MSISESPAQNDQTNETEKPSGYICRIGETNYSRVIKYINQQGTLSANELKQKTNWTKYESIEILNSMVYLKLINLRKYNNGWRMLFVYYIDTLEKTSPPKVDIRTDNIKLNVADLPVPPSHQPKPPLPETPKFIPKRTHL